MKTPVSIALTALVLGSCAGSSDETTGPVRDLSAPSAIQATRTGSRVIRIAWRDNSNSEDAFGVERRRGSGAFQQVLFVPPDVTVAVDSMGLLADSLYAYRVRALRFPDASGYSDTAVVNLALPFP